MKKFVDKSEDRQRFSLRKLSIGVASVLLGTTFMIYGGQKVHAQDLDSSSNSQKIENVESSSDKVTQANDSKQDESSANIEQSQNSDNKVVVNNQQQSDNSTSTSDSSANKVTDNDQTNVKVNDQGDSENTNDYDPTLAYTTPENIQEDANKIFEFDKDLSADQLAALGIDRDTYLHNGVKYRAVGSVTLIDANNKTYTVSTGLHPFHTSTGDLPEDNLFNGRIDWIYGADKNIIGASASFRLAPMIDGGTIYINKGTQLTDRDARAGLPNSVDNTYQSTKWSQNNPVDVNKVGTYDGVVDVIYKSELGQSVGVKVVVVDPKGKPDTIHINDPVPDPSTVVDNTTYPVDPTDPTKNSTVEWVTPPDPTKPGTQDVTIKITYPKNEDGTQTSTTVNTTVTVIDNARDEVIGKISVTRTVHFVPNNDLTRDLANPESGSVEFSLVKHTDANGKVTFTWNPVYGTLPAVPAKNIPGWIVDDQFRNGVPAEIAAAQGLLPEINNENEGEQYIREHEGEGKVNLTAYITYHQDNSQPTTPVNPTNPTEPTQPTTPVNPTNPTEPTQPTAPMTSGPVQSEQPTQPTEPTQPTVPVTPHPQVTPKDNNHGKKSNPGTEIVSPKAPKRNNTGSTKFVSNNRRALNAVNKTKRKSQTLPQTGSRENGFVAVIGTVIAAVGSLFGLASRKKRHF